METPSPAPSLVELPLAASADRGGRTEFLLLSEG